MPCSSARRCSSFGRGVSSSSWPSASRRSWRSVCYQAAQFGSPFTDGYHAYDPTLRAIYGAASAGRQISLRNLVSIEEQFHHIDLCRAFVVDWTVAGSVLLAIVGAYAVGPAHPARAMRNVAVSLVAVLLVVLLPTAADPDDGARPRYLSTLLLSTSFLVGPGWFVARDMLVRLVGARMTRVVTVVVVVLAPFQMGALVMQRLPLQLEREGLYRAVDRQGIAAGVVVVRAKYPTRYARNGPFFDSPVLYLSAPPDMSVDRIAEMFKGGRLRSHGRPRVGGRPASVAGVTTGARAVRHLPSSCCRATHRERVHSELVPAAGDLRGRKPAWTRRRQRSRGSKYCLWSSISAAAAQWSLNATSVRGSTCRASTAR